MDTTTGGIIKPHKLNSQTLNNINSTNTHVKAETAQFLYTTYHTHTHNATLQGNAVVADAIIWNVSYNNQ